MICSLKAEVYDHLQNRELFSALFAWKDVSGFLVSLYGVLFADILVLSYLLF